MDLPLPAFTRVREQRGDEVIILPIIEPQKLGWKEAGLCNQTDPEIFFPEKGGSTREAKRICRNCTVKEICLEHALETEERFGIWGGKSERERRAIKKKRAAKKEA